jgi:hypothetical protein
MHALATALVLLHGVVMRGPTMPVCQVGVPCSAPAPGAVLVFFHGGQVAARARAGDRGRYSVRLRPGSYTVRLASKPRIGSGLAPRAITLRPIVSVRVNFSIDTGIR